MSDNNPVISTKAKDEFSEALTRLKKSTEGAAAGAEKMGLGLKSSVERADELAERFHGISRKVDVFSEVGRSFVGFSKRATDLDKSLSRSTDSFIAGLERLTGRQDESSGTAARKELGRNGAPGAGLAREARSLSGIEDNFGLNTSRYMVEQQHSEQVIALEKATWETRLDIAGSAAGGLANIMQNLYVATGKNQRWMFEGMKASAVAEAVVQGHRAAIGAYAFGAKIGGPVLGAAFAATAAAAVAARIKQIVATTPGDATGTISSRGTANPEYRGGSSSAYPVPQRIEQTGPSQEVNINIYSATGYIDEAAKAAAAETIIDLINAGVDRNLKISTQVLGTEA